MLRNFTPAAAPARRLLQASLVAASLAAVAAPAPAAPAADAEQGRRLLEQYQCGRCHVIPGVAAARGRLAVPLASFGSRSYIAGRVPNTSDALVRWLVDPPSLVPGTLMPNLGVSTEEARRMAAYLALLR